ncbi:MAG: DUF4433 domain-containing protein [Chitinophagales bacterium]|nr:DUF4433 domain-containing protein [Chitinophagales bacterium]
MNLNEIKLHRLTHISNIRHIITYGITHKKSLNRNPNYKAIGDSGLIDKRSAIIIPNNNTLLGDYIPFYFGTRMPMLYIIQKGFNGLVLIDPEELIYCITNVQQILDMEIPFLFTNAHASTKRCRFYGFDQVNQLEEIVDFVAVRNQTWGKEENLDTKHKKEAEFLVYTDIPFNGITNFAVYNSSAQKQLIDLGIHASQIVINHKYYY